MLLYDKFIFNTGEVCDLLWCERLPKFNGKPYLIPNASGHCAECGHPWVSDDSVTDDHVETKGCIVAYMYSVLEVDGKFYGLMLNTDCKVQ